MGLLCSILTALYASNAIATKDYSDDFDVLKYVDPLIGTANGGHVFAGATLPFGMAKAVADTTGENQAGFAYDTEVVTGFSHMHDSGTGGSPSMGNFPIFAQGNCPHDDINQCKWQQSDRAAVWDRESPEARPGYFSISLANGVHAKMTTTNRSALYRFTFNEPSSQPLSPVVLLDLMDLPRSRRSGSADVDRSTGRLTGSGTFSPSFGIGSYKSYVCVDFKGAELRDTGIWERNQPDISRRTLNLGSDASSFLSAGAFARFYAPKDNNILVRVGVSFISVHQACSNAEREQPDFDFEGTVSAAESAWRKKLDVISVDADGVSSDLQTVFWSGAYRTFISPQDYTGENPLWKSDEPYYDSYYCIWDSFRSIHPLLTLVDPFSQSLMMRSLVDTYRHEGYLPDCRMSLCKGFTQGGSNADVVMADAYLKKVPGIDWDTAYEAVVKDAEDMGHQADYEKYTKRSGNWVHMFNPDQRSSIKGVDTNFTGFLQPRYTNGTWGYQDPILCSPLLDFTGCYLNPDGHETYEGSAWMYTFYAPHDMGALIKTLGGAESFTSRLSYLHDSGLLYMGDEQAFLPVYQFHYSGRPGLSAKQSHFYIPSQFNTTVNGIAGNDDSGAMGSFVVLNMMGLWPVPGQDVYLITPPYFKEVSIRNALTGKVATIRNVNFDPSYESIYIQSAKWNDKPWTKNWITHEFFADGGVLELVLGPKESEWGTHIQDLPPSLSDYH
ncbi:hypothetical protein N7497_002623 [Penicillium chrysogenum]|nr:hypothetical protein N7497_002623 [Penicillium chrysogenum]